MIQMVQNSDERIQNKMKYENTRATGCACIGIYSYVVYTVQCTVYVHTCKFECDNDSTIVQFL